MNHPLDWRGVSFTDVPFRFGRTTQALILVIAIANFPTVAVAQDQSSAPQPVMSVPVIPTAIPIPDSDRRPTTSPTISAAKTSTTSAPIQITPPSLPPQTRSPSLPPSTLALLPLVPITNTPTISNRPTAPAPTKAPTPVPLPTESPLSSPSTVPSQSLAPSSLPSDGPTESPSSSQRPTSVPSNSAAPSSRPSTSPPTRYPTRFPSAAPIVAPTGSPSTNLTLSVKRGCSQTLEVEGAEKFDELWQSIYCITLQSYTEKFGQKVSTPEIVTSCDITSQDLAGGRRKRLGRNLQQKILLLVKFTIQYESRYGYPVVDYPSEFSKYVNSNLTQVTIDMQERFLPVIEAQAVIVFNTAQPTPFPSPSGVDDSSSSPSIRPTDLPSTSLAPTSLPSLLPSTTTFPSAFPSPSPSMTQSPSIGNVDEQTSFVVWLAAGLSGATIVVLLLIWYLRRKSLHKDRLNEIATANGRGTQSNSSRQREGNNTSAVELVQQLPNSVHDSHTSAQYENYPDVDACPASPPGGLGTVADSIFSNPSMVSGGGSFSSNPEDNFEGVPLNTLQDEFDNYKNKDLEFMRSGVEESVYGAEGMMSLAMTRALMEDEDEDISPSWGGAEDPESIEANGLCETNDWLRKHDHSTIEERNIFFQGILNKMVITVRRGLISPSDATQAIHCCAAMLGLQLAQEQPNNVLLVHGMRKTNDLSTGRSYLVETFTLFGDVEGAATAPNNRGFGFVRFVSPKSVDRALERFRISEIEVQDVSVMIKSLKPDEQA